MADVMPKKLYIDDRYVCDVHALKVDHEKRCHVFAGDLFSVVVPFENEKKISCVRGSDIHIYDVMTVAGGDTH